VIAATGSSASSADFARAVAEKTAPFIGATAEVAATAVAIVAGYAAMRVTGEPLAAYPAALAINIAGFKLCHCIGQTLGDHEIRSEARTQPVLLPEPRKWYRRAAIGGQTMVTAALGIGLSPEAAMVLGMWVWAGPRFHFFAIREGFRASGANTPQPQNG
jgi:hypothetical protein